MGWEESPYEITCPRWGGLGGDGFFIWGLKDLWQNPRAPSEAAQGLQQLLSALRSTCWSLPAPPASSLMSSAQKGRPRRECVARMWGSWHVAISHQHSELIFSHLRVVFHLALRRGSSSFSFLERAIRTEGSLSFTAFSQKWISPSHPAEAGARGRRRALRGSPPARLRR